MTSTFKTENLTYTTDLTKPGTAPGTSLFNDGTKFDTFAVGSDNQVVLADSSKPHGVKWGPIGLYPVALNTIYANADIGSDSNPGTIGSPVETIQRALNILGESSAVCGVVQLAGTVAFDQGTDATLDFFPASSMNGKIIIRGTKDSVVTDTVASITSVTPSNPATDLWQEITGDGTGGAYGSYERDYIHNTTKNEIYSVSSNTTTTVDTIIGNYGSFRPWDVADSFDLFKISKQIDFDGTWTIRNNLSENITFEYIFFSPTTSSCAMFSNDVTTIFRGCRMDGNESTNATGTYQGSALINGCYSTCTLATNLFADGTYRSCFDIRSMYVEGPLLVFTSDCSLLFCYCRRPIYTAIYSERNMISIRGVFVNSDDSINPTSNHGIWLNICTARLERVAVIGYVNIHGLVISASDVIIDQLTIDLSLSTTTSGNIFSLYQARGILHGNVILRSSFKRVVFMENTSTYVQRSGTLVCSSQNKSAFNIHGNSSVLLYDMTTVSLSQLTSSTISLIVIREGSKFIIWIYTSGVAWDFLANTTDAIYVEGGSLFHLANDSGSVNLSNSATGGRMFVARNGSSITLRCTAPAAISSDSTNFTIIGNSTLSIETTSSNAKTFTSTSGSNFLIDTEGRASLSIDGKAADFTASQENILVRNGSSLTLTMDTSTSLDTHNWTSTLSDNIRMQNMSKCNLNHERGVLAMTASAGTNFVASAGSEFGYTRASGTTTTTLVASTNNIELKSQSKAFSVPTANSMTFMVVGGGASTTPVVTNSTDLGTQNCLMYVGP